VTPDHHFVALSRFAFSFPEEMINRHLGNLFEVCFANITDDPAASSTQYFEIFLPQIPRQPIEAAWKVFTSRKFEILLPSLVAPPILDHISEYVHDPEYTVGIHGIGDPGGGVEVDLAFIGPSRSALTPHYARATTDTAFTIMMSDAGIAQAFVNSVFADVGQIAGVRIDPVRMNSVGEVRVGLRGTRGHATMDYHRITSEDDHVIVEMQVMRHDRFEHRSLFYGASTLANQKFPARGQ
jgi:hypothetical protein